MVDVASLVSSIPWLPASHPDPIWILIYLEPSARVPMVSRTMPILVNYDIFSDPLAGC